MAGRIADRRLHGLDAFRSLGYHYRTVGQVAMPDDVARCGAGVGGQMMRDAQRSSGVASGVCDDQSVVEIGILTRGKASLSMTLSSLLLQDTPNVRIHIVDTGDSPVVNRDDVMLAMRLAFDREIPCSYERVREKKRGFSLGRQRLLEALRGPLVCFVDDDMALSGPVIGKLLAAAHRHPNFGCINPACVKATTPLGFSSSALIYTPGGLLRLDDTLRRLLSMYYAETVDIVDATKSSDKVWEVAFLSELLGQLHRPCLSEPTAVVYHLDYHELNNWSLGDPAIIARSVAAARRLAAAVDQASIAV